MQSSASTRLDYLKFCWEEIRAFLPKKDFWRAFQQGGRATSTGIINGKQKV